MNVRVIGPVLGMHIGGEGGRQGVDSCVNGGLGGGQVSGGGGGGGWEGEGGCCVVWGGR